MSGFVSIDQVNELLAERLEQLLPELIGGGRTRNEWIGAPTRQGGFGDSLIVALRGTRRGRWFHHAAGVGGDPLGLVNYCRFSNNDMKAALAWSRQYLGGELRPESEADRAARRARQAAQLAAEEREAKSVARRARQIFFEADENWQGTPAWHYLNNRLCGYLPRLGHLPRSIRFLPALPNTQLGHDLPAMVAAIVNLRGDMIAVHRTWLIQRGAGDAAWDRLRESDGDALTQGRGTADGRPLNGKKVLGACKGGAIRIWPGERDGRRGPSWSRLADGASITLAEGIETSLTLALTDRRRRVACVISSEGFATVALPAQITDVTVAADADPENKATRRAIERAVQAIGDSGRTGKVIYPPVPYDDWNSLLAGICHASAAQ